MLEMRYKYIYEQHLIVLKTSRDNFLAFLPATLLNCVLPIQKIAKKIPKKIKLQRHEDWNFHLKVF